VRLRVGRQYVAVVDTPGLDDSKRSDAEILDEISRFLVAQYYLGMSLKGIVYMHRITDNRMQQSSQRYFEMFKRMIGERNLPNVTLLTTMWGNLPKQADGYSRDRELRENFWKSMAAKGAEIDSYDGSKEMAEAIVCDMLRNQPVTLRIQRELVDEGKSLEETMAGKLLQRRFAGPTAEGSKKIHELDLRLQRQRPPADRALLQKKRDDLWESSKKENSLMERKPGKELMKLIDDAKSSNSKSQQ
jgi:hypothetical protein